MVSVLNNYIRRKADNFSTFHATLFSAISPIFLKQTISPHVTRFFNSDSCWSLSSISSAIKHSFCMLTITLLKLKKSITVRVFISLLIIKKNTTIYKYYFIFAVLKWGFISGCSVARLSRLVWDEEVAGSNPATPTKTLNIYKIFRVFLCSHQYLLVLFFFCAKLQK
jgi:hypothetical protein